MPSPGRHTSSYRAALARDDAGDGLDKFLDREGFDEQRGRAKPIGLLHRLFVRGAHDDRCRRKALPDATYERARWAARIGAETDEIGDEQIGSRVRLGVLEAPNEQELIALIAEDFAKEVSDSAVVLDDQDSRYVPDAGCNRTRAQFRRALK